MEKARFLFWEIYLNLSKYANLQFWIFNFFVLRKEFCCTTPNLSNVSTVVYRHCFAGCLQTPSSKLYSSTKKKFPFHSKNLLIHTNIEDYQTLGRHVFTVDGKKDNGSKKIQQNLSCFHKFILHGGVNFNKQWSHCRVVDTGARDRQQKRGGRRKNWKKWHKK